MTLTRHYTDFVRCAAVQDLLDARERLADLHEARRALDAMVDLQCEAVQSAEHHAASLLRDAGPVVVEGRCYSCAMVDGWPVVEVEGRP